jgi:NADH-quinone oxidoreductase subunit C/D
VRKQVGKDDLNLLPSLRNLRILKKLKLPLDGIGLKVPEGEIYSSGENPRGELGFYIYSTGGVKPYRVKIRPGSMYNLCIYPKLMKDRVIADAVAVLASLDPVVGEIDR